MKKIIPLLISLIFTPLVLTPVAIQAAPVNINQASASEIASSLKGIGQKKAEAIVAYREANGDFVSIEQLTNIKGIGNKLLGKVQSDILLEPNVSK